MSYVSMYYVTYYTSIKLMHAKPKCLKIAKFSGRNSRLKVCLLHGINTVPDIIKFTYYHCTSIDYSYIVSKVHCTLNVQYLTLLSLHTITVLPLTIVYIVSEVHCTLNVQYLTLLSLHTITVLPLTIVYIVSEVHCTLNVQYLTLLSLHTITVLPLTIVYIVSEVHCTLNVQYLTLLSLHTITVL